MASEPVTGLTLLFCCWSLKFHNKRGSWCSVLSFVLKDQTSWSWFTGLSPLQTPLPGVCFCSGFQLCSFVLESQTPAKPVLPEQILSLDFRQNGPTWFIRILPRTKELWPLIWSEIWWRHLLFWPFSAFPKAKDFSHRNFCRPRLFSGDSIVQYRSKWSFLCVRRFSFESKWQAGH